ncbi:distal tail protein Dit [Dolosicoccus paucivorans]|uniref:distal tail protein Dit n=1 Tax=Dolosicoccus paucivorans TaxID=84521 RepID=UPI00087F6CAC|nr:distal tail protein Dit [Dolosicoccus paucivorans]SDI41264.1 putative phage tail component, N-terminal domain-containing protein [Dolosicoccus paucivorans]
MYEFSNFTMKPSTKRAPSDNMAIEGTYLNELIDGYRQLSVGGRSLFSRDNEVTDLPNGGVWVNNSRLPARIITVKYQLKADTSESLRQKYLTLNSFLNGFDADNLAEIRFDDENEWSYYGLLNETQQDKLEDRLALVSEFNLLIPQPHKQKDLQSTTGRIDLKYVDKVNPTLIQINPTGTVNEIEITNGHGERIKLIGSYTQGSPITIKWNDYDIEIIYRERNHLMDLAYLSFPEEFYLRDGDSVRVTGASLQKVEWREKAL